MMNRLLCCEMAEYVWWCDAWREFVQLPAENGYGGGEVGCCEGEALSRRSEDLLCGLCFSAEDYGNDGCEGHGIGAVCFQDGLGGGSLGQEDSSSVLSCYWAYDEEFSLSSRVHKGWFNAMQDSLTTCNLSAQLSLGEIT
jgi:hypothetical protein